MPFPDGNIYIMYHMSVFYFKLLIVAICPMYVLQSAK